MDTAGTKLKIASFLVVCVCAVALPARASTVPIFSNLGPGNTYDTTTGWTIGFDGLLTWQEGMAFVPNNTATLGHIELAVSLVTDPYPLNVQLMTDAGGMPGTVLESYSFDLAGRLLGSMNPLLTANSTLNPTLIGGDQYWLVASTPDASTSAAWNWSLDDLGLTAFSTDNGSTWTLTPDTPLGAFAIYPTGTVPEPGTLVLLVPSLALLAALSIRFRI